MSNVSRFDGRERSWHRPGLRAGITAIVSLVSIALPSSAQTRAVLVLDHVTVVDVTRGRLLPDQRVVVTGSRIKAVGSRTAVSLPKDAQVVDAQGKYLIPGLWDVYTRPRSFAPEFFYPLLLANGVTGIRDPGSSSLSSSRTRQEVAVDTAVRWWREILAGARVGPPRQLLAGTMLEGDDRDAMERQIAALRAAGVNFLGVAQLTFRQAAAARQSGMVFGGRTATSVSELEASDSGIRLISNNGAFLRHSRELDTLCLGAAATVARCQLVADRFRLNGTWWTPTLIRSGGRPELGPASDPILKRFYAVAAELWAGNAVHPGWFRGALPGAPVDSRRILAIAHRVGMPIVAGTATEPTVIRGGALLQLQPPGFSLHGELAIYVAEGMTPLAALQSATLNPAQLIHGTDSLGTVAGGKLADLVLLDANPLADITNTTTIRAVVANGRYYDRAALDRIVAEVQRRAQREPEPLGLTR